MDLRDESEEEKENEDDVDSVATVDPKQKSITSPSIVNSEIKNNNIKNRVDICNGNNDNNGNTPNKKEKPTPFVNIEDLDGKGNIKHHKKDDKTFQAKQSREARARMKEEGMIE